MTSPLMGNLRQLERGSPSPDPSEHHGPLTPDRQNPIQLKLFGEYINWLKKVRGPITKINILKRY